MGVVLTTKQVGSRKAQLGKARAIGAAAHDVIIGFESRPNERFSSQFNRAQSLRNQ